jgi:valyl-tRNA synthetase
VDDFKPQVNMGKVVWESGKMSVRDKWMMSKLSKACITMNQNLNGYEFGIAQQTGYALWINEICDVYLELVKPVVYDKEPANADRRWAAQAVLWNALESGLRLLHPMMPYVTEELWQRLPGRGSLGADEKPSIMLDAYPQGDASYVDEAVETAMDSVMECIK